MTKPKVAKAPAGMREAGANRPPAFAPHSGFAAATRLRDSGEHQKALEKFDATRVLVAFCELRQDFRGFRTDRVVSASFLKETFGERPSALRARWRKTLPPRGGGDRGRLRALRERLPTGAWRAMIGASPWGSRRTLTRFASITLSRT